MDIRNTEIAFGDLTDKDLARAILLFRILNTRRLAPIVTGLGVTLLKHRVPLDRLVKKGVFRQFCGGETLQECPSIIERLAARGVWVNLDYAAESQQGQEALDQTRRELISAIQFASGRPSVKFVSVKMSSLMREDALREGPSLLSTTYPGWLQGMARLRSVCEAAQGANLSVLIDAEWSWAQDSIDVAAEEMMTEFNRSEATVYATVQLYRHDRLAYLHRLSRMAYDQNWRLGVKLVRGAYHDQELALAERAGVRPVVFSEKHDTDASYDEAVEFCLARTEWVTVCVATHNEESVLRALPKVDLLPQAARRHVSFGQLFGMADHVTYNLASAGYQTFKYLPYGPVRETIPYLARRARENGWVKGGMSRQLELLREERERRLKKSRGSASCSLASDEG